MFWVRRVALEPLRTGSLDDTAFTEEAHQTGDQFEHAVERFFADCTRACGYSLADIEPLGLNGPEVQIRSNAGQVQAPKALFFAPNSSFLERWAIAPPDLSGRRVAVMAATGAGMDIPDHSHDLLRALQEEGYKTILCLACPTPDADPVGLGDCVDGIFLRQIGGFDMALWGAALRSMPQLWNAKELLFVTDAVIGPLGDPEAAFAAFRDRTVDCVAFFKSDVPRSHFSRHLFALFPQALGHPEIRAFFEDALSWNKESESIFRYETRLLTVLENFCGLTVQIDETQEPFVCIHDLDKRPVPAALLERYVDLEQDAWSRARDLLLGYGILSQRAIEAKNLMRRFR